MHTWDPFTIFKYVNGSTAMHVIMCINIMFNRYYADSSKVMAVTDEELEAKKMDIIYYMFYVHFAVAFLQMVFSSRWIEVVLRSEPSIVIPSLSLFIQVLAYHGLIFNEMVFFLFEVVPKEVKLDSEYGYWSKLDRWDILIMMDSVIFLCNIFSILSFLIGQALIPKGWGFAETFHAYDPEASEKDFLEGGLDQKRMTIQITNMALVCSVYLVAILSDPYQHEFLLQWVLIGLESTFFVLSHGTEIVRVLGIAIYMVKIVTISIWGLVILYKYSGDPLYLNAEGKLVPNPYLLAYTLVQYFTINELIIWPIQILKAKLRSNFKAYQSIVTSKERNWQTIKEAINEPLVQEAETMVVKAAAQAEDIANTVGTNLKKVRSYTNPSIQGQEDEDAPADGADVAEADVEEEKKEMKIKYLNVESSIYCYAFLAMISGVQKKFDIQPFAEDYFFKATMIFFIQMLIIVFIFSSALKGSDGLDYVEPTVTSLSLRLLCCYLFHLSSYGDVVDSYQRLKYLRNNHQKFEGRFLMPAFLVTFYQLTTGVLCEVVNILFLTRQETLVDIIMNYVAFEGVIMMDNLYTETLRNMKIRDCIPENSDDPEVQEVLAYTKVGDLPKEERVTFLNPQKTSQKGLVRVIIAQHNVARILFKGAYFWLLPYFIIPLSFYVSWPGFGTQE